ncbi:MAG: acyltransferase [Myxococcales bacterium]|nr:acyltransferase [Myxococcales bacterium]
MSNKNLVEYPFSKRGPDLQIFAPNVFVRPESMELGNHVVVDPFTFITAGKGLLIGSCVHVSCHVSILGGGYCIIEDFVGICAGTRIITGTDDVWGGGLTGPTVPSETRSVYRSFVHCKRHSFLGTNCVIQSGVTLGEGAVVGSGAVVTKDLEPWGVYYGAPARKVKERPRDAILAFERQLIEQGYVETLDVAPALARIKAELEDGQIRV